MEGVNDLNLEELDELLEEVKEIIKTKKAEFKENAIESAKNEISEGDSVKFMYKNEEWEGKVVKINEKSFTAEIEDEFGETKKLVRQFHLYRGKTSDDEEAA